METIEILILVLSVLLVGAIAALFFVSRKSQKTMESMITLLMSPERARIRDAARIISVAMNAEVDKVENSLRAMSASLEAHLDRAELLEKQLGARNSRLVDTATDAARSVAATTDEFEKMLDGLTKITKSSEWARARESAAGFNSEISELFEKSSAISDEIINKTGTLRTNLDEWIGRADAATASLQHDIENNTNYMNGCVVESDAMRERLNALSDAVADGFKNITDAAANYENLMSENEKSLASQIEKMEVFSTESRKMLKSQTNELAGTANAIGGQIKLAEASIEKQTSHLATAITSLMEAAQNTENYIRNISNELAVLTGRFQTETREFASSVVGSLNSTQGAANATLEETKQTAAAFSESVRMMADGVQDTIAAMETAHNRLSNQSAHLAEISTESNEKLQPLAELVEKYSAALPEMTNGLADAAENFESKIKSLATGLQSAMLGLADSSVKLEHMSDTSRATLTDLMSDYARAADTMETLTTSMAETRARAPMAAVSKSTGAAMPAGTAMTTAEFMKRSENLMERMHELSVDLTRTIGTEIPDAVWKKYNAGDKTIFSKWFAKMLGATDKKKLQQLFKSDAVFRSQATQFVRGFAKMLGAAEMTDNRDMLSATLLKTDLGQMYLALRAYL